MGFLSSIHFGLNYYSRSRLSAFYKFICKFANITLYTLLEIYIHETKPVLAIKLISALIVKLRRLRGDMIEVFKMAMAACRCHAKYAPVPNNSQ